MPITLESLTIRKFRGFQPTELRFGKLNVLLGLNATGKTSLLELIAAVLDGNFAPFAEEPLDVTYRLGFAGFAVTVDLSRQSRSPSLPRSVTGSARGRLFRGRNVRRLETEGTDPGNATGDAWSYRIEITHQALTAPIVVALDPSGHAVDCSVPGGSIPLIDPGRQGFLGHILIALSEASAFSQAISIEDFWDNIYPLFLSRAACGRYDESLGAFDKMLAATWTALHSDGRAFPVLGGYGLVGVANILTDDRTTAAAGRSAERTFSSAMLPFLAEVATTMGFSEARMRLRILNRKDVETGMEVTYGSPYFEFGNGNELVAHERLSYGQKRLLSFYYHCNVACSAVVADEIANGLHHAWIDDCMRLVSTKQAFLSSQNPVLLDAIPLGSVDEVQQTFLVCRRENHTMVVRNLPRDEAEGFFRAYGVGFQHVGEILRDRGLW